MKISRFEVKPDERKKFRLKDCDCADHHGVADKEEAKKILAGIQERLGDVQERLYAQDSYGILLIFQALDAAGKDGTIKAVLSGLNPQGCQVFAFKSPSAEELDHDFLWRCNRCLPERGRIGIFNRSYYEEVLVVRVHPEFLEKQKLPRHIVEDKELFEHRFEDINAFERYLVRNAIIPIKFFLNVSKDEQLKRFLSRLDEPEKNWKFVESDVKERGHFDDYQDVYEDMLRHTSTPWAPWYVIPADNKWYARVAVGEIIAQRIEELDPRFPEVSKARRKELALFREELVAKDGAKKKKPKQDE